MSKAQRFNFTYIFSEDPAKITITNARIDKQKALKGDCIYNIEKKNGSKNRGFRRFITYTIIS